MENSVNIILFDDEKITKTVIESYLSDVTFSCNIIQYDFFDENLLKQTDSDNIIILNIGISNSDFLNKVSLLSENKKNHFIIISNYNSTDINVKSLRCGAEYFLLKPIVKDDFIFALNQIHQKFIRKSLTHASNINAVISAETDCGKSIFTVNTAEQISRLIKGKVLILDFNNTLNNITTLLNTDIPLNFSDALKLENKTADVLFEKTVKYNGSNLYLISNNTDLNKIDIQQNKLNIIFEKAKEYFKYILIDLNPNYKELNEYLFKSFINMTYVILSPQHTSILKAQKLIQDNLNLKPYRIILNNCINKPLCDKKEIEQKLEKIIFGEIPYSTFAINESIKYKKTLTDINPETEISQTFKKLAQNIINRE